MLGFFFWFFRIVGCCSVIFRKWCLGLKMKFLDLNFWGKKVFSNFFGKVVSKLFRSFFYTGVGCSLRFGKCS